MRLTKTLAIAAATVAFAISLAPSANAQMTVDKNRSYFSPDQQFGFGVNNRGLTVQYALGPAFHLGINLALDFYKDSSSATFYDFGPYAKFLFSGDVIKPYAFAALGLIQPSSGKVRVTKDDGTTIQLPDAQVRLYVGFGGEHFLNQNVGLYGHVNLIDMKLSPEPTQNSFGLLGATAGVEFFF